LFVSREPVRVLGSRGSGSTEFEKPRAVAVSPVDSTLVVIDRLGRVQVFNPKGEFVREWLMPQIEKGTPSGCSIDKHNRLVIADTHYHRILVFDLEGKQLAAFGSYGRGEGELVYPTDVVCDDRGNYFVVEYGGSDRVVQFSPAGRFVEQWGRNGFDEGEFQRPMSIALHGDRLYVADSCNHRIQVFDLDGQLLDVLGGLGSEPGQFRYPYDLAVDGKGNIYVCEYGNHRVQKLSPDGKALTQWGGKPGREPGTFLSPWGVAIDPAGRLIVADTMNFRVQVFAIGKSR
ncbi:SMP-30/gluconolactonase/LRE family protein, partial [Candidatus Sumerlaeota bacterium]